MKSVFSTYMAVAAAVVLMGASGCQRPGDKYPGTEYMPDMVHSIAYEANYSTYYSANTWATEAEYRELREPGLPVKGTIPRGTSVYGSADMIRFKIDTHSFAIKATYNPYHYADTEPERLRAQAEITSNPLQPTSEEQLKVILAKGKVLYNSYCAVCHGEDGDGEGPVYKGGKYPLQPAMLNTFGSSTDGRFYHAIMYGKNAMLGHADKLSYEERWMVIHQIRNLQYKKAEKTYNLAAANGVIVPPAAKDSTAVTAPK